MCAWWRGLAPRPRDEGVASWALPLLWACVACGPEVSLDYGADADVYVRAQCEDKCAKYEECAPLPDNYEECSVTRCVELYSATFDDPCFAEEDEFFRCLIERESCEEYFDGHIPSLPGSICYEFLVVFGECRLDHPRPMGG